MKRIGDSKGFTLLELLVALTIFSVGLLAIASMSITSMRGNNQAATLTEATFLAQGVLEEIQTRDSNDSIFVDPYPVDENWPLPGSPYSATYTINEHPASNNVLEITVQLTGPRRLTLTGYKGLI